MDKEELMEELLPGYRDRLAETRSEQGKMSGFIIYINIAIRTACLSILPCNGIMSVCTSDDVFFQNCMHVVLTISVDAEENIRSS